MWSSGKATGKVCLVCWFFPQRKRGRDSPTGGTALSSEDFLCYLLLRKCCVGSMPMKLMQNTVVTPGEMSVAPSSSHPANSNPLRFCLVLQSFSNSKNILISKCFSERNCLLQIISILNRCILFSARNTQMLSRVCFEKSCPGFSVIPNHLSLNDGIRKHSHCTKPRQTS